MYKVDKIKNFFDCDLCHELLVDPISIPCGNNVCKIHLDNLLKKISKEILVTKDFLSKTGGGYSGNQKSWNDKK